MASSDEQSFLTDSFSLVRRLTEKICEPLEVEDHVVQPFAEVSPPKWHLAHTTWFFENFILRNHLPDHSAYNQDFFKLFNSYYKSQGEHWSQGDRGSLSRPTLKEVLSYRAKVTEQVQELIDTPGGLPTRAQVLLQLGLHHEQQHQELLLMDIKRILWHNPSPPAYSARPYEIHPPVEPLNFVEFEEGLYEFGHEGSGFAYDNEGPRHRFFLRGFGLAHRPVTNGEFADFIEDGGYHDPLLWLSDAWDLIQSEKWLAPLYWRKSSGEWGEFGFHGFQPLDPNAPVNHISFFEAEAYARWSGYRLPMEYEWERAASLHPDDDQSGFLSRQSPTDGHLGPRISPSSTGFQSLHGGLWEWTTSSYNAYPGYQAEAGALGEYNGKFMNGQRVLRGGCFATPSSHYRHTYRNFYQPEKRWPFTGIRLAKEL